VSDAPQDRLTVDQALASIGDAIDTLIGEVTVVGAVHIRRSEARSRGANE